eukprot:GSMAST32.ASY1.ANO1.1078.1 assembled CDS
MPDPSDGRYDDVLLGIAQQQGGIEPLLETFFSFLHRRTDFYVVQPPGGANMGFPPGVAESLLLRSFRKLHLKPHPDASPISHKGISSVEKNVKKIETSRQVTPSSDVSSLSNADFSLESTKANQCKSFVSCQKSVVPSIKYTDDGKQIPIGNGGITSNYWWTQTLDDVTVNIPVPFGTKSKDINCAFSTDKICIRLDNSESSNVRLLDGVFDMAVRPSECLWQIEDSIFQTSERIITLTLDKKVSTWWKSVLKGHQEIDCTKVDSTQKLETYNSETQAAIRKIMFDQSQKAKGLPSSDEIKTKTLLETAMKAPGAPNLDISATRIG